MTVSFGGLTLRDLEYVAAVAEFGSFTAAAEACGVSQPSLSAQVRKVEGQLDLALFERTGREVRVTTAGRLVVDQARRVLSEARHLFEVARGVTDPLAGELRLGAIATLGPYLIRHLLGPLRQEFPDLTPVFREGLTAELCDHLLAGDLDAVLLSLPVEDERLAAAPILFEPFVGMCSTQSPLAAQASLALSSLDTDEMIVMAEGHCIRDQTLALCSGVPRAGARRHAASIETLRHLVAAGAGHTLVPRLAVRSDPLLDDHLRYQPIDDDRAGRTVALAWRASDPRGPAFQRLAFFIAALDIPGTRPAVPTPPAVPARRTADRLDRRRPVALLVRPEEARP